MTNGEAIAIICVVVIIALFGFAAAPRGFQMFAFMLVVLGLIIAGVLFQ
jgi:hypothetical protein